ncbi:MAG: NUDIX hydrolase [Candidatus Wolfebacteria bacterium]|nr:NUDIX hydrolase [Candidatus Wolfebacteria bacterium]
MRKVLTAVKAVIEKDKKILFIKQVLEDTYCWDLPGGKVEYGESPYETLKREVMEEVGLEIEIIKPLGIWWFFHGRSGNQIACTTFICKPETTEVDLSKNPAMENIKEFRWMSREEFLNEDLRAGHDSLRELIKSL